ncbi:hypothetical protein COCCADRAFT_10570 [Bipolaris zeicola 26-R-13]|uniref:Uncharacterized protein n=1 Tax=Cochliobolus carbonum (strain 26-R-13) TaxID=930089 RepID=W6Y5S7_COCC2|nr:uncharacterized protein COCCADRAFT_10570 [Bipolaris zeicola 26-R-13]EUC26641.1 hypothetical protein COCCADRAFT_10570 [Bipolaris zeicola 26-R-13]
MKTSKAGFQQDHLPIISVTYTSVPRSTQKFNTLESEFENLGALPYNMILNMGISLTES